MGEPYYSDFDINHEGLYSELERVRSENYHLKRQLKNQRSINKGQRKHIKSLERKLKTKNKGEQHYRNGRKRGKNGFNG